MATQQYDGPFQAVVIEQDGGEFPVGSPEKTVDKAARALEGLQPHHDTRSFVVRDVPTQHTVRVVWPETPAAA